MAQKKSNAEALRSKRLKKLEQQKKKTDLIAYIAAGVGVLAMVAVFIIALF